MVLRVVDMGNSRLKWADAAGGALGPVNQVAHEGDPGPMLGHPAWQAVVPRRLVVISVVGKSMEAALTRWVDGCWGLEAEFLRSRPRGWGLCNGYQDPARLGADRWAALVAARQGWPDRPLCVCDCGTALTVDVVDAAGRHLGGAISAGLGIQRCALSRGTAAISCLERMESGAASSPFARATAAGVSLGTLHALAGSVSHLARRARELLGAPPVYLLSGGDASVLLPLLDGEFRHAPRLVLEGALIMAENPP